MAVRTCTVRYHGEDVRESFVLVRRKLANCVKFTAVVLIEYSYFYARALYVYNLSHSLERL